MGSLTGIDESLQYPVARRDESIVDDYHGFKIPDPYRWLEDPDAEEVKDFVQKQAELTDSVLNKCDVRDRLREKITKLFDSPQYDAPFKQGNKYFYFHNTGLQPQSVLYVQDSLDAEAKVLLDPNTLSEDGTVAITTVSVSEDAKYLAYALSNSGSDWVTIKLMRIEDHIVEADTLDGKEVDAGIETDSNLYHELYYHFLGTEQSEDILCWKDPEHPKYTFSGHVTEDGQYLVMYIRENFDQVNKVYYYDLSALPEGLEGFRKSNGLLPFVKLIDRFDAQYEVVANDDSVFTFRTSKDAPKYKIVRVDLREPNNWSEVVPEAERDVLESASAANFNQMILSYLSDVNFLTPGIIYQCNLKTETPEMKIFRETSVPGFDRSEFHVHQVFVPSKDGSTKIPMFIVAKKNIKLDGSHPCLLYGYGGFNASITPSFSVSRTVLMRHLGAVFCIANIRGGGEYGEEWHKDGALAKKQNCFDDFISASEYLISAGYTQSRKLCIEGESNGGLLIGACINQRPDLFGCALAHVGVMDMLRLHKFTIGHAGFSEYGCPEKKEEFDWLIKYSPLHNVRRPWEQDPDKPSQYPSTLLLTADHDDRVVPLHSLKLLATMQYVLCTSLENSPQTNPILGRIECKAGHGAGRPTQKMIDEAADCYGFMAKMLGASWIE
ncbi:prolyl oligopeptidase family protein [Citrus sinensis]|uniref:Prolyl oligopeptidase family protein n=1 Tax=Citrus sinensis TaxID=2711 RepID=A0ACB8MA31_CITSI|nr:prolyl oligopeptidase family protein [Citrus sinensis]